MGFCAALTSVTIPDSVTRCAPLPLDSSIGKAAFQMCSSLVTVNIGNSVLEIGDAAFIACTSLVTVNVGNSVAIMGATAFAACLQLASITLPDLVVSIGHNAFTRCSSLVLVSVPASMSEIGEAAFDICDDGSYFYGNYGYGSDDENSGPCPLSCYSITPYGATGAWTDSSPQNYQERTQPFAGRHPRRCCHSLRRPRLRRRRRCLSLRLHRGALASRLRRRSKASAPSSRKRSQRRNRTRCRLGSSGQPESFFRARLPSLLTALRSCVTRRSISRSEAREL